MTEKEMLHKFGVIDDYLEKIMIREKKLRSQDNDARLTLRVPEDLKKDFESKSGELNLSMSQVGRKLIEDWIKSKPKKFDFSL